VCSSPRSTIPCAHSRSDREEDEVVHTARDAEPPLAERRQVDVVLERDREPEALLELRLEQPPLEPGHVGGELKRPVRGARHARHAHDGAVDPVGGEISGCHEGISELGDRVQRPFRVGTLELDVLPGADRPVEVADRAAQEPGTEVEPEDERRLRDRLEVDGAVARSARRLRALADETGLYERPERERDRRLRDSRPPRDLRP
jgi:hypothetical protein